MIYVSHITRSSPQRGFALVIAIVLSSVVLAVGAALLDISYKQVLLSSGSKQSQYAFYNADSALECTLYWDQQYNAFDYTTPYNSSNIQCDTVPIANFTSNTSVIQSVPTRVTTFNIPCQSGGTSATVTVYKKNDGHTRIFTNGYNTCDASNQNRIERGLKISY